MAILGKDVFVRIGTQNTIIAGQRGGSLDTSTETIDTTTKDSNGWQENEAGLSNWSISLDGVKPRDAASHTQLIQAFLNKTKVQVSIQGPGINYSGRGLITSYPIEMPFDDVVTYSCDITGDGPLNMGATGTQALATVKGDET